MNKLFFALLFLISSHLFAQRNLVFPTGRFHTGDDPEWKDLHFDDSHWVSLKTEERWESQGFGNYDGYAWYRFTFRLPSSIKKNAYWRDTLVFHLGKIDDVDQTFFDGVQLGQTGAFPTDAGGYQSMWDVDRIYYLPASSPLIKWDQENIICIRVYDHGGDGGMFQGLPTVKFLQPIDRVVVSLEKDSARSLDYVGSAANNGGRPVEGTLTLSVKEGPSEKIIRTVAKTVTIPAFNSVTATIPIIAGKRQEVTASFKEKHAAEEKTDTQISPYMLTPLPGDKPRINSASVFGVRPGSPVLFKIAATGKKPLRYQAMNLPDGLVLDESSGIITGKLPAGGTYEINFIVTNPLGSTVQNWTLKVGNELALTPPMGWNSWNCWGITVTEEKVKSSAEALIEKGLIDHGWTYINIDDGWQAPDRASDGTIRANQKFNDMNKLADWLHRNGLKFGVYSSPGLTTCGQYTGSLQHEMQDATSYGAWGVDYLKYDWCSYQDVFDKQKDTSVQAYQRPYQAMEAALQKQPRDIVYSLCQYGMASVWKWGGKIHGNSWRTTGDINDSWASVVSNGFDHPELSPYAKPGNWNDPDMLVVGLLGWSGTLHASHLTPDEQYAHISLWCLLSSPLLIGCDISKLDAFTLNLLTNDEVLAIDQDPAGKQARQRIKTSNFQVWVKELADGNKAIGVFNMSDRYQNIAIDFSSLGLNGKYRIRDMWRQVNAHDAADKYAATIPPHGVSLIKITAL